MSTDTSERVYDTLHEVTDPCSAATGSNLDIVQMGLVKSVTVTHGHADIDMRLTTPVCHMVGYFIDEVENRVGNLPEIDSVALDIDNGFEWTEDMMSPEAKRRRRAVLDEHESRYREEHPDEMSLSDA